MAKIAVDLERAVTRRRELGTPGCTTARVLAQGEGWTVADVMCTSGPYDSPFEEQHTRYTIAIVLAGTFQYRSSLGHGLMTPGALLLGNQGQIFECGHEHADGDRCLSFSYAPEYFEGVAADAGTRRGRVDFTVPCVPPLRSVSPLVAHGALGAVSSGDVFWEELAIDLAGRAVRLAAGGWRQPRSAPPNAEARVTRTVRMIERRPDASLTVGTLAQVAGLSPYHFLRTFERLTGITPHQYILRARLREAALRLVAEPRSVLDIALDSGFSDASNFNRAFRAEFGVTPGGFRRAAREERFPAFS